MSKETKKPKIKVMSDGTQPPIKAGKPTELDLLALIAALLKTIDDRIESVRKTLFRMSDVRAYENKSAQAAKAAKAEKAQAAKDTASAPKGKTDTAKKGTPKKK